MNSIGRRGLSKKECLWFISIVKNKIIANCQCVQVDWDTDIWFIGVSLISHLSDRAAFRASSNLGLANKKVHWLGTSSMHWRDLIPKFQLAMMFIPPPVMILVHVGGNDLVTMRQGKLIKNIKKDMQYLASVFSTAKIIWSDILPRKSWRGVEPTQGNLDKMNSKRKRINRAGRQVARNLLQGRSIIHEIDITTNGLYKSDGVYLTSIGNDIILNTFQEALAAFFENPNQRIYDANL